MSIHCLLRLGDLYSHLFQTKRNSYSTRWKILSNLFPFSLYFYHQNVFHIYLMLSFRSHNCILHHYLIIHEIHSSPNHSDGRTCGPVQGPQNRPQVLAFGDQNFSQPIVLVTAISVHICTRQRAAGKPHLLLRPTDS